MYAWAEYLAIQGDALQDLAMCALLHDNALTQYITEELERNYVIDIKKRFVRKKNESFIVFMVKKILLNFLLKQMSQM